MQELFTKLFTCWNHQSYKFLMPIYMYQNVWCQVVYCCYFSGGFVALHIPVSKCNAWCSYIV